MCINSRYIYNPYSRKSVLVKCGKCEACRQEKACARSNRIRNNVTDGTISLFVTLTYANDYIPYIRKSDLLSDSLDINVYRDNSIRYTFSRYSGYKLTKSKGVEILSSHYVPLENRHDSDVYALKHLANGSHDKVGVCYNSDFQNFIKRLNQYLNRTLHYENKYSYFYCSELGSASHRPHFHALFFIPKDDEETFRNAITTNWPYADMSRTKKYVEVARDAASYVSSYVNSHFSLSSPLSIPDFTPKHNYSRGFGTFLDCFSLRQVLSKIDRGNLYYYTKQKFDGECATSAVPIPTYVLNRYFPWCKGFSWLSESALFNLLRSPERCGEFLSCIENPLYSFTPKETYKIYVRLENCYKYFHLVTGLGRYDYALYFLRAWNKHKSLTLMDSYKDVSTLSDFLDFYENANDLYHGIVQAPTLSNLLLDDFQRDYNKRRLVLQNHAKMVDLYDKLDKQKKVTNFVMSYNGHNV